MDFYGSFALAVRALAEASDAPPCLRCDLLCHGLALSEYKVLTGVGKIAAHLQPGLVAQSRDGLRSAGRGWQRWIVLDPVNEGIARDHEVEELIIRDLLVRPCDVALQLVEEIHGGTESRCQTHFSLLRWRHKTTIMARMSFSPEPSDAIHSGLAGLLRFRSTMPSGRKDRQQRLTEPRSGSFGSSSQDYVLLATQLFVDSAAEAQGSSNGNYSTYTLAGIPVLFSTFRALLIEGNFGMFGKGRRPDVLAELGNGTNECVVFCKHYDDTSGLESSLRTLAEVRNEIVHPTHLPAGTSHGTPEYLVSLRTLGLLQSSGRDDVDYVWIDQLKSHRLFAHTFSVIAGAAKVIVTFHHADAEFRAMHQASYRRWTSLTKT